jgi:undecaprenyl-diphosphatase
MPPELPLRHAVALGLLQGPAELLPISSSAHLALVPALLGWPSARLTPGDRKAFHVALHTGTAAALAPSARPRLAFAALTAAPAAIVGFLGERAIERRLSSPRAIAFGLLAGSAALTVADALGPQERDAASAGARDAALLGLAQACALVPGVSRTGATLSAARALGFRRPDAAALAREAAVPVLLAAAGLKGLRLAREGLEARLRAPFAAGTAAALVSTAVAVRVVPALEGDRPLWPYAAERAALATVALARCR